MKPAPSAINDFQKYGDFTPDGKEFVVRRFDTHRPWINYTWNDKLLISIDLRGRRKLPASR